jgi:hypothetical protein
MAVSVHSAEETFHAPAEIVLIVFAKHSQHPAKREAAPRVVLRRIGDSAEKSNRSGIKSYRAAVADG